MFRLLCELTVFRCCSCMWIIKRSSSLSSLAAFWSSTRSALHWGYSHDHTHPPFSHEIFCLYIVAHAAMPVQTWEPISAMNLLWKGILIAFLGFSQHTNFPGKFVFVQLRLSLFRGSFAVSPLKLPSLDLFVLFVFRCFGSLSLIWNTCIVKWLKLSRTRGLSTTSSHALLLFHHLSTQCRSYLHFQGQM